MANLLKNLSNDLEVALYVLRRMHTIREDTGYGMIKVDVKDNLAVFAETSLREHFQKDVKT